MSITDFPEINGQKHSFADVFVTLRGKTYRGVTKIDYGVKRGMTDAHGTGPNRVGVALGKVTAEASLEMYRADGQAFLQALGPGFTKVPFPITVTYRTALGAPLITDTISGARIAEAKPSASEGDEPVKMSFTLNVGGVRLGGLAPA